MEQLIGAAGDDGQQRVEGGYARIANAAPRIANRKQKSTGRADGQDGDGAKADVPIEIPSPSHPAKKKRARFETPIAVESEQMSDDHIVPSSTSASSNMAVAGSTLGSAPGSDDGSNRVQDQHADGRPSMPKPAEVGIEVETSRTEIIGW